MTIRWMRDRAYAAMCRRVAGACDTAPPFLPAGFSRSVQNGIVEGASQARVRAPDGLAFSAPDRVSSRHQVLADKYARYRRKTL